MSIEIDIVDVPDKEQLVAWLWFEDTQWGEISQETGDLMLTVYTNHNNSSWAFKLDDVINALEQAKQQLISG